MCRIESTRRVRACACVRVRGPTSERRRELDHRTMSSPVCCRDAMRSDSGATVTLRASLVRCLDDAPGHPGYHPDPPPPKKRNHTARRDSQRRRSEIHSCVWRARGRRGEKAGNRPPHLRLWSEPAPSARLERRVSQAAGRIQI